MKKRSFNFTGTIFQKLFEIEIFEFSKKGAKPNVSPGLTFGILRYILIFKLIFFVSYSIGNYIRYTKGDFGIHLFAISIVKH